ncbi:hypothetical protein A6A12_1392 [Vibrio anguillarum]|nr:hypothetical protein A6A12_1392 [Vibrio anguillarum]
MFVSFLMTVSLCIHIFYDDNIFDEVFKILLMHEGFACIFYIKS